MRRFRTVLSIVIFVIALVGCADRKASHGSDPGFSIGSPSNNASTSTAVKPPDLEVTRGETDDQGAGITSDPNYALTKNTLGGSYMRRQASSANFKVTAGIHGNPHAFK